VRACDIAAHKIAGAVPDNVAASPAISCLTTRRSSLNGEACSSKSLHDLAVAILDAATPWTVEEVVSPVAAFLGHTSLVRNSYGRSS
jgi:hypothetical protein